MSPRAFHHSGNGLQQNLQIQHARPAIDVFHVKLHPALERDAAAPHHLPQASDAGLHAESAAMPGCAERFVIAHWQRTRTYEAHVAFEHVDKLWQLVQAALAQESADRCDAWIV